MAVARLSVTCLRIGRCVVRGLLRLAFLESSALCVRSLLIVLLGISLLAVSLLGISLLAVSLLASSMFRFSNIHVGDIFQYPARHQCNRQQ